MTILADLPFFLPEIVLFLGSLCILIFGVFRKQPVWCLRLSILLVCVTLFFTMTTPTPHLIFNRFLYVDGYAIAIKAFMLAFTLPVLIGLHFSWEKEGTQQFEYPILILLSVLGMMIMVSSYNLLTIFMGLELQSLSLYILTAIRRDDSKATEAALKYFILGALSTGLLLYGFSFVYGLTGTFDFQEIALNFSTVSHNPLLFYAAFAMISAGLFFKISAAPFHMWIPDVYEGAPSSVVVFLASVPKIAAVAMIMRLFAEPFIIPFTGLQHALSAVAVLSMVLGVLGALYQSSIKRLIAYSSIANMGYIMIGFIINTVFSMQAALLYTLLYTMTVLGVFFVLLRLRYQGYEVETIENLKGLGRHMPGMAFALSFFLFSLAGIPPLAGFFGKLYIFEAAVSGQHTLLALFGVLTSVISAAYYLWILKLFVVDEDLESKDIRTEKAPVLSGIIFLIIFGLTLFFVKPNLFVESLYRTTSTLFVKK